MPERERHEARRRRSSSLPRVVVVTRPTWYEELVARHGTRAQADFFLKARGSRIDELERPHAEQLAALQSVLHAIPVEWRRVRVGRGDLDRFLFEPDDIVVAIGQDGLVANTAKYLEGQPVLGVNPSPDRYEGVLVTLPADSVSELLRAVTSGRAPVESRTMAEARLDDGQRLLALNEVFIGHRSHQSARYEIHWLDRSEYQSSSGVIVSSGTGATGWARSIHRERDCDFTLPRPADPRLAFFMREAWPSVATGTSITAGILADDQSLEVVSHMNGGGVLFGDGIEQDRLEFPFGQRVTVRLAQTRLNLVRTGGPAEATE